MRTPTLLGIAQRATTDLKGSMLGTKLRRRVYHNFRLCLQNRPYYPQFVRKPGPPTAGSKNTFRNGDEGILNPHDNRFGPVHLAIFPDDPSCQKAEPLAGLQVELEDGELSTDKDDLSETIKRFEKQQMERIL